MRLNSVKSVLAISLISTVVLSGCGFIPSSQSIDPPPNKVNYVKQGDALNNSSQKENSQEGTKSKDTMNQVKRELYLLDAEGHVTPQVVELPKTQSVAKQALQYLVKGGPVTNILPNGFQAVLPAGTIINGVNLTNDGTVIADFSKDIKNYKVDQEEKILQAITWTLTQFKNINKVEIRIDGVDQSVMPVGKTPIGNGLTRAIGINNEMGRVVDVTNSDSIVLYFLAQHNDHYYYVPVTQRVSNQHNDIAAAVQALVDGPIYQSGLLSVLGSDVALVSQPIVKDGVVTLNFNSQIYMDKKSHVISNKALNAIVLTLTNQPGIKKVAIQVDGSTKVMSESGESLVKPVSRPVFNVSGV